MSNTTTMFDYKGEIFSGRELLAIEIGREIEQERIIKLLENSINDCTQPKLCTNCIGINWAIALIKEEK